MNQQQTMSLIATVIALALGPSSYFVSKGILTADQATQLQPAIVTIVTLVGGALIAWWGHTRNSVPALVAAVNNSAAPVFVAADTVENVGVQQVALTPAGVVVPDHSVSVKP